VTTFYQGLRKGAGGRIGGSTFNGTETPELLNGSLEDKIEEIEGGQVIENEGEKSSKKNPRKLAKCGKKDRGKKEVYWERGGVGDKIEKLSQREKRVWHR